MRRSQGADATSTWMWAICAWISSARKVSRNGKKRSRCSRGNSSSCEYLMRHAGQVVTRTMLIENVWDYHFDPQTNVIDVHIEPAAAEDRRCVCDVRCCTRCAGSGIGSGWMTKSCPPRRCGWRSATPSYSCCRHWLSSVFCGGKPPTISIAKSMP